jgi:mono/diheme cytochrome c family protein
MTIALKVFRLRRAIVGLVLAATAACAAAGSTAAQSLVERGNYLVNSILACGNCHAPRTATGQQITESNFAGGLTFTTPAFNATASNITPDRETGIGAWSDAEIKRALVEGVRPNHGKLANTPLAAVMPVSFFKAIMPQDLDAIVSYLRSVKPVRSESPLPVYKLPVKHGKYPGAKAPFIPTMMDDPIKRGAYLVTIGHCMECHSPQEKGVSDYSKLGKGGRYFGPQLVQGLSPGWTGSVARNITSHPVTGIGAWSDAEIRRAITKGISRDGRKLQPPMAFDYYSRMTASDLNAIVAFLRTVPPLE